MKKETNELRDRLVYVFAATVLLLILGTFGYYFLFFAGKKSHPGLVDCLYQTVVLITTQGIDVLGIAQGHSIPVKLLTMGLILLGVGVGAYAFTTLTAFVVEGELANMLGRRRMDRDIARLNDHYIVCGSGRTGRSIIQDLLKTQRPFVVIDNDELPLRELSMLGNILYIIGDATEESVLESAGLSRAAGLLASLATDRDNLFLVLTARHLNAGLRIIARGYELSAEAKLKRAGADAVVYPNHIGGMRMVSQMVRPAVVGFLDQMLRDSHHQMRFEEVVIHDGNKTVGKTLAESGIRQVTGLLVVACLANGEFIYNPPADTLITAGMALVVMGEPPQIAGLHEFLGEPEAVNLHDTGAHLHPRHHEVHPHTHRDTAAR